MKKLILSAAALALLSAPLAACDGGDHAKAWDKDSKASWSKSEIKTDKKAAQAKKSKSKVVVEAQAKQKKI